MQKRISVVSGCTEQFRPVFHALLYYFGHRRMVRAAKDQSNHSAEKNGRLLSQNGRLPQLRQRLDSGSRRLGNRRRSRQASRPLTFLALTVAAHPSGINAAAPVVLCLTSPRCITTARFTTAVLLMTGSILLRNECGLTIGIKAFS